MSRFPKSRFNRLRIVSIGNSLLISVGIDLNKFTILQFKDAIRFAISYILYLKVKNEYSMGHFALK